MIPSCKGEKHCEKTGRRPRAADIQTGVWIGNPPAGSDDAHFFCFLPDPQFKPQLFQTGKNCPRIVAEQDASQQTRTFGQRGKKKRTVGNALGSGNCDDDRFFSRSLWHMI